MSIDVLQTKIRKMKCPIVVDLTLDPQQIPAAYCLEHTPLQAMEIYTNALLEGLKATAPAVRFSFDQYALVSQEGLGALSRLLKYACELGYYVLLDGPAILTPWAAQRAAMLLSDDETYPCHGMIIDAYIGSDAVKPFVPHCKEGKSLFVAARTPNKSAAELQDLMTGSRLVHIAGADMVNRLGESLLGKSGYSQLGVLTSCTGSSAVSGIRSKFSRQFLLVDGLDYPGGNGKNASYGFDRFGHGCALSVGPAITAAWNGENAEGKDPVELARKACERISANMSRYITIL